jgi:phosphoglycolate phosphatase
VAAGHALGVVTTKHLPQAQKIVGHLPFGKFFTRIYGPDAGTAHSAKAEMIAQALQDFAIAPGDAAMIGDRHFDIEGARANGVRAIGVTWGFGDIAELNAAGADAIAHTPAELTALLGAMPLNAPAASATAPVPPVTAAR